MDLPIEAIREYQEAYLAEYGIELDADQARQQAERLLNGFDLILQLQRHEHEQDTQKEVQSQL